MLLKMKQPDARQLAQQINILNAAVHAICFVLTADQKRQALDVFEPLTQFVQAKLEASPSPDEELKALVELQQSIRLALLRPSQNPSS